VWERSIITARAPPTKAMIAPKTLIGCPCVMGFFFQIPSRELKGGVAAFRFSRILCKGPKFIANKWA
jgi:hypothetical protein